MIKYETIDIPVPSSLEETRDKIKEYNEIGWRMVTMYNGLIFFDRKIKTRIVG